MIRQIAISLLSFITFAACAQEKSKTDSLVFKEFYSTVLQENRRVVVHLPLNYSKERSKSYPVMYVLDAGTLDFNLADRLFTLSSAGLARECIVVGILNAKNARERDFTPPFMQTETDDKSSPLGKADAFLGFIKRDLVPLIDSTYRTTGYRMISGHSRGGLFVLYSLIEDPGLFDARFCYSTPAWRFDNVLIDRLEESLKRNEFNKVNFLFFSVGEKENENIRSSFDLMRKMLSDVRVKKLRYESYFTPMADHQSNPVLSSSKGLVLWGNFYDRTDRVK